MAFSPSVINGRHWLYSKNSGSFPNFGAFITGSGGSGRITAFYNVSSTISSSATTAVGSIVTGSNYIVDVTYAPFNLFTGVYLNSNLVSNVEANGTGSLSTSASLLLLNNTTSSNSGTIGNLYNFKVYNPLINSSNIRKNYNSMCSRFGLPLALYTPPSPLLLDLYPGAAAAYSLRRLSDFYGGSAIQVRRSSDNAVLDIGFTSNGDLDTGALLAFCGAGNGFVTTWYDQSGNARNATQSTAANQPQIVSSGTVILENGKPSMLFDGSNDVLVYNGLVYTTNTVFATAVFLQNNSATFTAIASQNSGGEQIGRSTILGLDDSSPRKSQYFFNNGTSYLNRSSGTIANNTQTLMSNYSQINNYFNALNGSSGNNVISGQSFTPASTNGFAIGNLPIGGAPLLGEIQEIIIWNSDQSANKTEIETNINNFYSIY
jgi:hypothetical protein